MRITSILSAAAVTVISASLLAQARPSFTGKWTLDWASIPRSPGATGPDTRLGGGAPAGGALGEAFTAIQDATTLTIHYVQGQTEVKLTFALDGTETKNTIAGRRDPIVSRAVWQGDTLLVTTTTPFGLRKRTLSITGGQLVLAIEEPVPDGPPIISRIRYTKG